MNPVRHDRYCRPPTFVDHYSSPIRDQMPARHVPLTGSDEKLGWTSYNGDKAFLLPCWSTKRIVVLPAHGAMSADFRGQLRSRTEEVTTRTEINGASWTVVLSHTYHSPCTNFLPCTAGMTKQKTITSG